MPKYSSLHIIYAGVLTGVITALAMPVSANYPGLSQDVTIQASVKDVDVPSLSSPISEQTEQVTYLQDDEEYPNDFNDISTTVPDNFFDTPEKEEGIVLYEDENTAKPESNPKIGGNLKGLYAYKEIKIKGKDTILPGFKPYDLCMADFVPAQNPFKEKMLAYKKVKEKANSSGAIVISEHVMKAQELTEKVRKSYVKKDFILQKDKIRTAMAKSFSKSIEDAVEQEASKAKTVPDIANKIAANVLEETAVEVADPTAQVVEDVIENDSEAKELANAILPKPETTFETKIVRIKAGDTFEKLLTSQGGVSQTNAHKISLKINRLYKLNKIRQGQKVVLTFAVTGFGKDEKRILSSVSLDLSDIQRVVAELSADGIYKAFREDVALETEAVRSGGKIHGSIAATAHDFGIPTEIVAQFVTNFSHSVDFRRDIRSGDAFQVMYEQKVTPDGEPVYGMGELLYASITLRGKTVTLYRYEDEKGFVDYYDENGHGIKKGIRRRPLGRRRISSPFGMRRHPILKTKRMHWGIDYVAPSGTPIPAAGDGVIEVAERKGAYGKYIKVRHNSKFKTAYAHMKNYAKGIKPGKRVRQGDVIGYVGNTGRSTGPHLHYEVHKYGKRVNPLKVKIPVAGRELTGLELKRFVKTKSMINQIFASLSDTNKHAKLEKSIVESRSNL